ncbi:lysophospholipid acyltransferase family protein [Paludicola sp. MB14-C6]|uniref:lysophospholipid acyltransferase family protein n=1 Tax=Paludihabitans sp. MB14-C6 TaxID=3070656 RepID=UPI0027DC54F0|nr:lysophospholipid acyltransferase family protein [Paludicola sp. MB14-C6]WMJ23527.1 lysophospholipid acyltransferase family protein [Paludicola sp. MB14-C6]
MTFYLFAQQVVLFIMRFGFKIKVENKENLPSDRGFVLASNHRSNLDPLFIGLGFKRKVCFMAKEELFQNPILGFIIRKLGAFPVSRGKGDHAAIDKAVNIVQSGGVLGIFPEGTRSKDGVLKKAKSGAVLVASMTHADIIPVGIRYGERKFIRREITVVYGEPIKNEQLIIVDNNRAQLKAACGLLMSRIAELLGVNINDNIS